MKSFFVLLMGILTVAGTAQARGFDRNPEFGCEGDYELLSTNLRASVQIERGIGSIQYQGYPVERLTNIRCGRNELSFVRNLYQGGSQFYSGRIEIDRFGNKSISGSWSGTGGSAPFQMKERRSQPERENCYGSYRLSSAPFVAQLQLERPGNSTIQYNGYPIEAVTNVSCERGYVTFTRQLAAGGYQVYKGTLSSERGRRFISGTWSGTGGSSSFSAVSD